jgi:hypothetical protein
MDAELRPADGYTEALALNLRAFEAIYAASVFEHLHVYRTIEALLTGSYCGRAEPNPSACEAQLYWYSRRTGYWASTEERRAAIREAMTRGSRPGNHGFDRELEQRWYAFLVAAKDWSQGLTQYSPSVLDHQVRLTKCLSERAPRDLHLSAAALRQEINQIEGTLLRSAPRRGPTDPWSSLDTALRVERSSRGPSCARIQSARAGTVILRWLAARLSKRTARESRAQSKAILPAAGEPRTLAETLPTTGELIQAIDTWLSLNPPTPSWPEAEGPAAEPPMSETRLGTAPLTVPGRIWPENQPVEPLRTRA